MLLTRRHFPLLPYAIYHPEEGHEYASYFGD